MCWWPDDSAGATLVKQKIYHKTTSNTKSNRLGACNRVSLVWVPGHIGIPGNERADELARKGSSEPIFGPEPALTIMKTSVRTTIREWIKNQHLERWVNLRGQKQSKKMLRYRSANLTKNALQLSRQQLRTVVGLITGHCVLRKHHHNMGRYLEEPTCRLWKMEKPQHTLFLNVKI